MLLCMYIMLILLNKIQSNPIQSDQVYFWRKAGKALKRFWKTGKNTENMAGNRKTPFWSHGKVKINLRKAGKSIFLLRKAGNRPPIPGPQTVYQTGQLRIVKTS